MTRGGIITALSAGLLAVLLLCGAASCGDGRDDKFTRQCNAHGGVVHTIHRGNSTSRVCKPAPQPQPLGWQ